MAAGAVTELGYRSFPALAKDLLHLSGTEAAHRMKQIHNRCPRPSLTGPITAPRFPRTAAAQAEGRISDRHARAIDKALFTILDAVRDTNAALDVLDVVEDLLLDAAEDNEPGAFDQAVDYIIERLDPDGTEPKDHTAKARRGLDLGPQHHGDLTSNLTGLLTAETRALLEVIFAKLARPGINNPTDPDENTPTPDGNGAGTDAARGEQAAGTEPDRRAYRERLSAAAARDHRSAAQRRHDALKTALEIVIASGQLGSTAGLAAQIVFVLHDHQIDHLDGAPDPRDLDTHPTTDDARGGTGTPDGTGTATGPAAPAASGPDSDSDGDSTSDSDSDSTSDSDGTSDSTSEGDGSAPPITRLIQGHGTALTATGSRVPIRDALRLAADKPAYLLLVDANECPLWLGRTTRLASAAQRIALIGAQRGCTAPGCTTPAVYCQVHHLTEWQHGGATDIDQLALTCGGDHRNVLPGTAGYTTDTVPPGQPFAGRPRWRRIKDPTDPGRVNHAHHPDEVFAAALSRWRKRIREVLGEHPPPARARAA